MNHRIISILIFSLLQGSLAFRACSNLQNARYNKFFALHSTRAASDDVISANVHTAHSYYSDFIKDQLDLCLSVTKHGMIDGNYTTFRSRFHEHPRCTARFGEVISHAFTMASTMEERATAIQNAAAVLQYAGQSSDLVSEALVDTMVQSLRSQSIKNFRIRQIISFEEDLKRSKALESEEMVSEHNEMVLLGRLYYSAAKACENCLHEIGLSVDHAGFTVLLAMCRAATTINVENQHFTLNGMKLDGTISDHFNAIKAPGCRFLFSPHHGLNSTNVRSRSRRLVVAFSSLGNGLVRFEFGGSLGQLNRQLQSDNSDTFDVLFVADPSQSWYQKDSHGQFAGFQEYEKRIRLSSLPYSKISLVGDSMGGSAALLFSHLATNSVVAFSPQVDLNEDVHVSRNDMTQSIRDEFENRLYQSIKCSIHDGVMICIHRGIEEGDIRHSDALLRKLNQPISPISRTAQGGLEVVEHTSCSHHQIAVHLKEKGDLVRVLSSVLS